MYRIRMVVVVQLVTTIALLAALYGGSGGVAWGQVTPSYSDCNNDYGAGESTVITPPGGGINFGSIGTHYAGRKHSESSALCAKCGANGGKSLLSL